MNFNNENKKVTFPNGKTFDIYSKETTKGKRFYYFAGGRMFPISKDKISEIDKEQQTASDTYQLLKDGKIVFEGTENECYFKLQRLQGHSADYATKYGGWKVEQKK